MGLSRIAGSVARISAVVLGGAAVLASAGVSSSICGCPANCSPVVCVDSNFCAATLLSEESCKWSTCAGIEFLSPGSKKFTGGIYGTVICTVTAGIKVNGVCVFNPNGATLYTYKTTGYSSASFTTPCP